jgi:hypothetical protein
MPADRPKEPRKGDYPSATRPMRNRIRPVKFDCRYELLSLNLPPDWNGHEENSGATIVEACTCGVTIDTDQVAPK